MNVPPVDGSSLPQMFPHAEEIGSLFSENTASSSRDNVTLRLSRYEAKASRGYQSHLVWFQYVSSSTQGFHP
jgi:hypothetical protein